MLRKKSSGWHWVEWAEGAADLEDDVRSRVTVQYAWIKFMTDRDNDAYYEVVAIPTSSTARGVTDSGHQPILADLDPTTIFARLDPATIQQSSAPLHQRGLVVKRSSTQFNLFLEAGDLTVVELEARVKTHPYVAKRSIEYNGNKLTCTDPCARPYHLRFVTHDEFRLQCGYSRNADPMVNGKQVSHIWVTFSSTLATTYKRRVVDLLLNLGGFYSWFDMGVLKRQAWRQVDAARGAGELPTSFHDAWNMGGFTVAPFRNSDAAQVLTAAAAARGASSIYSFYAPHSVQASAISDAAEVFLVEPMMPTMTPPCRSSYTVAPRTPTEGTEISTEFSSPPPAASDAGSTSDEDDDDDAWVVLTDTLVTTLVRV
jgi:hypothetical protein